MNYSLTQTRGRDHEPVDPGREPPLVADPGCDLAEGVDRRYAW